MSIRKIALRIAFAHGWCWLIGHSFYAGENDNEWQCDECAATKPMTEHDKEMFRSLYAKAHRAYPR